MFSNQNVVEKYVDINYIIEMEKILPVSPSRIANECFCFSLKKAERLISRRYDEALAPFDLRNGQFSMLTYISGANPINIQSIANFLNMDRTTTTAALKPLEKRELISINCSSEDSRIRLVSITKKGLTLLAAAIPAWENVQNEIKDDISENLFIEIKENLKLIDR